MGTWSVSNVSVGISKAKQRGESKSFVKSHKQQGPSQFVKTIFPHCDYLSNRSQIGLLIEIRTNLARLVLIYSFTPSSMNMTDIYWLTCHWILKYSPVYVKVTEDLKHLCFFLKKLISRQRVAPESASFNLIPITHNIKGLDVQICLRGSPGGEI